MNPWDMPDEPSTASVDALGCRAFKPRRGPFTPSESDWERASRVVAHGPTLEDGDATFSITLTLRHNMAPEVRLVGPVPPSRTLVEAFSMVWELTDPYSPIAATLAHPLTSDEKRTAVAQESVDVEWCRARAREERTRADERARADAVGDTSVWCGWCGRLFPSERRLDRHKCRPVRPVGLR